MEWTRHDGMNITTMYTNIQLNTRITSILTLRLSPSDNSIVFSCKTGFSIKSTELEKTEIRNVPTYEFVWNYTTTVLFGPQRVDILPHAESYSSNDELYCSADGNPKPSCVWIDLDANKEVANNCLLLLDENMKRDQVYNYQCRAENAVNGVKIVKLASISFRIADGRLFLITVAMGIVCAILLLIAIAIGSERIKGWIAKLTTRCRRGSTTEPDVLPNVDGNHRPNGLNGVANYELVTLPQDIMQPEIVACGNRQPEESEIESQAVGEGIVSNKLDQGRELDVQPEVPVYAEVNKLYKCNKPDSATLHPSKSLSVDSKLNRNEYVVSECKVGISDDIPKNPLTKEMSIGLDGTVYAELKTEGDLQEPQSSRVQFQDPMFNKSDYASIDHTTEPPPPPQRE